MIKARRIIGLIALILLMVSIFTLIMVDTLSDPIPISSGIISFTVGGIVLFMHMRNNTRSIFSFWRDRRRTQTVPITDRTRRHQAVSAYLRRKIAYFEDRKKTSFIRMDYVSGKVARMTRVTHTDSEIYSDPLVLYERYPQFVLIGLPGVGKSTVLRELFCNIAKEHLENDSNPIPLWIDLSDPNNPTDAEAMFRYWCESPDKYNLDVGFDQMRHTRPFVLLLDGLNEMPLQYRKERARSLSKWLEENEDVRAVTTCRVRDYQDDASIHLGHHVPLIYVEPFERKQIDQFVRQSKPEIADWFMKEVDRDDAIFRLAQIPLHLGMLIELSIWQGDEEKTRRLPNRTLTLFEEYLEARYDYEKKKKRLYYQWDKLKKKLEKLAYKMVEPGRNKEGAISAPASTVRRVIGRKGIKDAYNLYLLTDNTKADDKQGINTIQFFHQSLHGYFALPRLRRSINRSYNRWWVPFARSSPSRTATIIRQIGDLGDTAEIAVDTLLPLIRNPDSHIRTASVNALKDIGIPAIVPLVNQLSHSDEIMVENSMHILREIGEPILGPILIHALKNDNQIVRQRIASILDNFNVPYSLTRALRDTETNEADFKGYIASVLGELRSSRAVQPLIPLLKDDDKEVRADIAWALGEIRDESAIMPLVDMVKSEKDKFVQVYVAHALEQIGLDALSVLSNALLEEDRQRRQNVLNTLHCVFKSKTTLRNIHKIVTSDRLDRQKLLRRYLLRALDDLYSRH